jgi:transcription elongation GreA/GreB family factor
MNKKQIISDILTHLEQELVAIKNAANNAHLAATDDQSVAETQYDTLAIEASYLAEGQSRRVAEIQTARQVIEQLVIRYFQEDSPITLSAWVELTNEDQIKQYFFIAPAAGGFSGVLNEQSYTVITPNSPMGKALIGKFIGDEVELIVGSHKCINEINGIY